MSGSATYAQWIAVDWGTSHLRAWAIGANGRPLVHAGSDDGMGRLDRSQFEPALMRIIAPWLGAGRVPVIACGMVGSRQGWAEAPYRTTPCAPLGDGAIRVDTSDRRLDVTLIPGVRQTDPADVMRGEETQIAGFLAGRPGFDGVICLPGTHTKWVQVSAGEIVSFRTFMTGEMFALLSEQSVLRHSIGPGWDEMAFAAAVADAISRPEALAGRLFGLRAGALLTGLSGDVARARLSGFLIGAELAAARPYWLGQEVALVGAADLCATYAAALAAQAVPAEIADATEMTLAGLSLARTQTLEDAK